MKRCLLWFLLPVMSCQVTTSKFNQIAVKKNNEAAAVLNLGLNDSTATVALGLYDEAILTDSTYYFAYANKANLLCQLTRFKEAIEVLDRAVTIRPLYVEGLITQSLLYERLQDRANANLKLTEAELRLVKRKRDGVYPLFNEEITGAFIHLLRKKTDGISRLQEVFRANPGHPDSAFYVDMFYTFSKDMYISDFCGSSSPFPVSE